MEQKDINTIKSFFNEFGKYFDKIPNLIPDNKEIKDKLKIKDLGFFKEEDISYILRDKKEYLVD